MSKTKILITGGLGFIFSHVTEYFVKKGWDVVVIDNESEGSHPEIIDGSFTYHNMSAGEAFETIIRENPDYIIHAAAISDVDFSIKNPLYTIQANSLGNLAVFEAARHCTNLKKLLYVSTDEVYGECEVKKTEEDIIFPKNPYSMSKAHGSLLRLAYDNTYPELQGKTCETRFCNVFGPRQDPRKVFPRLIKSIKENTPMPVQNGGKGYREYIYVKNIPEVIDIILEKGDRTYNVTLNDGLTVNQLIGKVEEIIGRKVEVTETERPGMDLQYQMSNERITALGWKPKYTLEEGIKEYLEHEKVI